MFAVIMIAAIAAILASVAAATTSGPTTIPHDNAKQVAAWLREASRHADAAPPGQQRDRLLGALARAYARSGDTDGALQAIGRIDQASLRIYGLSGAFQLCMASGNRAGARLFLDAMSTFAASPAGRQAYYFTDKAVIEGFVALDDINGALRFIHTLHEQWAQESGYETLAGKLAELGRADEAIALIDQHQTDAWKGRSWLRLVDASASKNLFDQAHSIAQRIEPPEKREQALVTIVRAHAAAGELDAARILAAELNVDQHRAHAQRVIDESIARSLGVGMTGLPYLAGMFPQDCAEVGSLLARGELRAAEQHTADAVQRVDADHQPPTVTKFGTITDASRRAVVRLLYLDLARAQFQAGDVEGYQRSIAQAHEGIEQMDMEYYRDLMLAHIARTQIEMNQIEDAMATLDRIKEAMVRNGPLIELTRRQTEAGNYAAAERAAEELSPSYRGNMRAYILVTKLEQGVQMMPEEAVEDANAIASAGEESAEALESAARALVHSLGHDPFSAWFDQLPSPVMKAYAAIGAAAALTPSDAKNP